IWPVGRTGLAPGVGSIDTVLVMQVSNIGIDFDAVSVAACLCEGERPFRWTVIGDGRRSRMARGAPSGESSDRVFWRELAARVTRCLGRVEPVRRNGYEVIVATHAAPFTEAATGIEQIVRGDPASALREAHVIPAWRALLCRWLAEARGEGGELTVAV